MAKPGEKQSVVLVPFPFHGHIAPMLELGKMLHSKGFYVIAAHPDFNSPNPLSYPDFTFLSMEAGLSSLDTSLFQNGLAVISALNQNCSIGLMDLLVPMMKNEAKFGKITCIIYDITMSFANAVADHLKVPGLVLSTNGGIYMQVCRTILQLEAQDQIPLQESRMLDTIPQLEALRYKDLGIGLNTKMNNALIKFYAAMTDVGSSVGIIWNSMELLENSPFSHLKKHYHIPFFPIGPFHKMAKTSSQTSSINEDKSCLEWLEKQSANSVLYISFGSSAEIKQKEMEETAWGLAGSGIPFLWVLRPAGLFEWTEILPDGFKETVGEKGCIVKWAPQKEVLAHSSVGGFLSHCGWNSAMESISEGVPMICRPFCGDQLANSRFISHVWNVGIELEEVEDRAVVERTVKRVMVENEGKELRERMMGLKSCLDDSTKNGGCSYQCLNDLTKFIQSFP